MYNNAFSTLDIFSSGLLDPDCSGQIGYEDQALSNPNVPSNILDSYINWDVANTCDAMDVDLEVDLSTNFATSAEYALDYLPNMPPHMTNPSHMLASETALLRPSQVDLPANFWGVKSRVDGRNDAKRCHPI